MVRRGGGLAIRVLERIGVQVKLVNDLIGELRVESSYRGLRGLFRLLFRPYWILGLWL